jgi:hypothetical protein
MRSFTLFLLAIIIAATITAPGHKKFNKYLAKKGKNVGTCLGGTRHNSYQIFTLDYVDYCGIATIDNNILGGSVGINKRVRTDKYLGLFGTFFKL